ncbi:hypothetical protein NA57DRAFT_59474 [Rhizodiscina lignyota]|uniref:N-acetylgalactosaminide beta-1,3-galactosyltransferase n=1 Tax=Rhizodiscina lignyota TaxID=1504668 RepID=A0A9P4M2A3_9PEZI|nr:hypothetical protein NA57DRAFT_59474 [Rhizodiscina lignyota]
MHSFRFHLLVLFSTVVFAFILLNLKLLFSSATPSAFQTAWIPILLRVERPASALDVDCTELAGADRIVVTIKTGATEANMKIPAQLRTSLRCAPNIHIFSDMEQTIEGHQVHDVIKDIPAEVINGSARADFDLYRKQQELKDPDKIIERLRDVRHAEHDEVAAWTLDKYKNIHILEDSWAMQPDRDWYLHIDADTYVVWPTLLEWTRRLDPSKVLYLGSLSLVNENEFAHGGSGILMSRAAMHKVVVEHNGTAARWDSRLQHECCGDFGLAMAIREFGINVTEVSPTIQGDSPRQIPFAPDHWCKPLATLHHITSYGFEELRKFEHQRSNRSEPLTFAELYHGLMADEIFKLDERNDWDNLSEGNPVPDVHTSEDCRKACQANEECFQSLYDGTKCRLETWKFRVGVSRNATDSNRWQSSWNSSRISNWVSRQKPCEGLIFPLQSNTIS